MTTIYIPQFTHFSEDGELESIIIGAFKKKEDASIALINKLLEKDIIANNGDEFMEEMMTDNKIDGYNYERAIKKIKTQDKTFAFILFQYVMHHIDDDEDIYNSFSQFPPTRVPWKCIIKETRIV